MTRRVARKNYTQVPPYGRLPAVPVTAEHRAPGTRAQGTQQHHVTTDKDSWHGTGVCAKQYVNIKKER